MLEFATRSVKLPGPDGSAVWLPLSPAACRIGGASALLCAWRSVPGLLVVACPGSVVPLLVSIVGGTTTAVGIVVALGGVTTLVASEKVGRAFELVIGGGACNVGGVTSNDVATVGADIGELV